MTQPGNFFSGDYLDRRAELRSEEQWLASAEADPATRYIAMHATTALMDGAGGVTGIAFLTPEDPRVAAVAPQRRVLLGWFQGARCVLLEFDTGRAQDDWLAGHAQQHFAELRPLACNLEPEAAGLLAYARALTIWRSNHQHCGRCGHHTVATRAGHARRCTACQHESFPRIDPAIIVLVQNQGRALLGRQPGWPPGRYSTIAGFVEPGESLEDAVRREVREETGIIVRAVRYHSSQPWPFPQALMLGFIAEGDDGEPQLHDQELEDARWFTREQVRAEQILLPPAESISRRLVEHWLHSS